MGRRLARYYLVNGQSYGPGDEVPADVAARLGEDAWEGGASPAVVPAEDPAPVAPVVEVVPEPVAVEADTAEPAAAEAAPVVEPAPPVAPVVAGGEPPRIGKGSSRSAWVAYAESVGVVFADDAGRDDIIAAVDAAKRAE